MTMTVVLVGPEGRHHALSQGPVTVGAGFGEVPAVGLNQLLRLRLPYTFNVWVERGFEEQFYILAKSLDGFVTDIRLDALQFEYDDVSPILRLRADLTATPAQMEIWLEAHHSIGR